MLVIGCAGCAGKSTRGHKKLPTIGDKRSSDVVRPVSVAPVGGIESPERKASMRLVYRGKGFLDAHDPQGAATSFRDAINVDGTNGIAYYYLAYVYAGLGNRDSALGLLDKAEAMLSDNEEWMKRIDGLKEELGAGPPPSSEM
jgi:tetratricopeptide (TPR) repeat protein